MKNMIDKQESQAWNVERVLEAAVVLAALVTIPLVIAQEQGHSGLLVILGDWLVLNCLSS